MSTQAGPTLAASADRSTDQRARTAIAALLLLAAALFGAGAMLERAGGGHEETTPHADEAEHSEAEGHDQGEPAEGEAGHAEPTFLGVNLESPALIGLGVLLSVAAAIAAFRSDSIPVLGAAALFAAAFVVLHFLEAFRQGVDNPGLFTVAALAGLAHAAAAFIALRLLAARC